LTSSACLPSAPLTMSISGLGVSGLGASAMARDTPRVCDFKRPAINGVFFVNREPGCKSLFWGVCGIRECLWHSGVFVAFGVCPAQPENTLHILTHQVVGVWRPSTQACLVCRLMGMRARLVTTGHTHKWHNKQATIVCGNLFVKTVLYWIGRYFGTYDHVQFLRLNGFSLFKIN
jgi:hypothetical protein